MEVQIGYKSTSICRYVHAWRINSVLECACTEKWTFSWRCCTLTRLHPQQVFVILRSSMFAEISLWFLLLIS